ncbi:class I SAM-dependent methyltransferase [Cupriavidus basilensis]|uniref:class I SAM-dependent methyltransferase n=1 Tax=Cupriavidus basilensis TaxID=68895 RepID=UPI0020A699D4|nr:class I SAM-dependent methyltransferase [Cupriavidus basilensis]MCP3021964.1 class I SAM-dependent methyltransferase [Cupriavidus basilensis]MDR3384946.1 class I SAM-dependent methyltransferase [Cupriavidus basilensis]
MYSQTQIDPVVSFRNSQGEQVRGTIINLQRKALVMEIYNPYSIVQVSEVLSELSVRMGSKNAYLGKAVVMSLVNTGLTAVVSLTLIDEWRELSDLPNEPKSVGREAELFINDWDARFNIRRDYQIVVNEMRAFLSEVSRWVEQVDLTENLPKTDGRLREDVFYELATPIMLKVKTYLDRLEGEAEQVDAEIAPVHRTYAQSALHPLLLRAPFVYRTFTKPLGYAGDYEMVNQILNDPQQGPTTYFQIVNTAFLKAAVATAHRNRIDLLVDFLSRQADAARAAGRPFRILNVGCGPAFEIQRFVREYPQPELLSFQLVDFSEETLAYTKSSIEGSAASAGHKVSVEMVHQSVHELLKRKITPDDAGLREFDAVYCAGLFDYLSDKVCSRLLSYFAARTRPGGQLLVTNVHSDNPEKFGMEHLLEWYLIYRDEARMSMLLPEQSRDHKLYVDQTGVNVFAEAIIL